MLPVETVLEYRARMKDPFTSLVIGASNWANRKGAGSRLRLDYNANGDASICFKFSARQTRSAVTGI